MAAVRDDLLAGIGRDRERLIGFLSGFLQTHTPNPPGETRPAYNHVRALLDREGIAYETVSIEPELPNIVATIEGSGIGAGPARHLALNGHMDVFPVPEGEIWTHGPWSGAIARLKAFTPAASTP